MHRILLRAEARDKGWYSESVLYTTRTIQKGGVLDGLFKNEAQNNFPKTNGDI